MGRWEKDKGTGCPWLEAFLPVLPCSPPVLETEVLETP